MEDYENECMESERKQCYAVAESDDAEIQSLSVLTQVMNEFDEEALPRVLAWLFAKYSGKRGSEKR